MRNNPSMARCETIMMGNHVLVQGYSKLVAVSPPRSMWWRSSSFSTGPGITDLLSRLAMQGQPHACIIELHWVRNNTLTVQHQLVHSEDYDRLVNADHHGHVHHQVPYSDQSCVAPPGPAADPCSYRQVRVPITCHMASNAWIIVIRWLTRTTGSGTTRLVVQQQHAHAKDYLETGVAVWTMKNHRP